MNREKIILWNRDTRSFEEEEVFKRGFMDFIYGSGMGLFLENRIFSKKVFSTFYGNQQKKTSTQKKIKPFLEKYKIDLSDYQENPEGYKSFNDFFIRKIKPEKRPFPEAKEVAISPADSRLLSFKIETDKVYQIKGKPYSLDELFQDQQLAEKYKDGTLLVFRLAPMDYHRFCYVDNGTHGPVKKIEGVLHSVNPIALKSDLPVFPTNYRELTLLETENFNEVVFMEVGALIVGKIIQHNEAGKSFKKGEEKGYFEFGASTIILVYKKGILEIDADIVNNSLKGIETLVKYGSSIGRKI